MKLSDLAAIGRVFVVGLLVSACESEARTDPSDASIGDARGDVLAVDAGAVADGAATNCMPATHPGTVTFIDADTGKTTVDDAATVPDSIKWHGTGSERVPVVKVVKHTLANGMIELLLYGPCGQLLEVILAMT